LTLRNIVIIITTSIDYTGQSSSFYIYYFQNQLYRETIIKVAVLHKITFDVLSSYSGVFQRVSNTVAARSGDRIFGQTLTFRRRYPIEGSDPGETEAGFAELSSCHSGFRVQDDMASWRENLLLLAAVCLTATYGSELKDKDIAKAKIEVSGLFCNKSCPVLLPETESFYSSQSQSDCL